MSLINDALKRARAAQKETPPAPPTLHFRPVEGQQERKGHPKFLFPAAVAVVVIFVFFLGWQLTHRSRAAQSESSADLIVNARPAHLPAEPTPAPQPAATKPAAQPAGIVQTKSTTPQTGLASNSDHASAATESSTNTASVDPLVAKPAPLKLQAIFFQPSRPSALINGKTVLRGDKVGEFRVLAIDKNSATLASSSVTNILTVGE